MNSRRFITTILGAVIGGIIAIAIYSQFFSKNEIVTVTETPKMKYAVLPVGPENNIKDFTYAAEQSVNAVVHVMSKSTAQNNSANNLLYEFFYGGREAQPRPQIGFGSGVIISNDGYIVTNHHVVDGADELEVILNNKKTYTAELIGSDPNSDLALLKIDAENLSALTYGNSDNLKIGEWVLAVGNPFNLTSTVTAGIVSAKGRNLNIIQGQMSIESFIQTDAAVNPGNSGGALVNTRGELVGINTAIASRTGSYSGYSFAIPVGIVKKVVADLIEYGEVQRALLGVTIQDITSELAKEKGIEDLNGVYINGVSENGAAKDAGIKTGDVIVAVNDTDVKTTSELQEQISKFRPSNKIKVIIKRDNKRKQFDVVLRNSQGNTNIVKTGEYIHGARFEEVSDDLKKELGIRYGVQISELRSGKFKSEGIREGFVVVRINNKPISSVKDIRSLLEGFEGGVYIEGIYPDGTVRYYAFGL